MTIHFRNNIECKFWGDAYNNAVAGKQLGPDVVADAALVLMRMRQGVMRKVGRKEGCHIPFDYYVCAVCEERKEHQGNCANMSLKLPIDTGIPVVE